MILEQRYLRSILLSGLVLFSSGAARAADFCVGTETDLHNALATAAANGEDDTVRVVQGSYSGSFIYSSTENFAVSVLGGFSADCGSRTVDPTNTIIDANATGPALVLTNNKYTGYAVEGLTLQGGTSPNGFGGGLFVHTDGGNVNIARNIISDNSTTDVGVLGSGGGGVYVDALYGRVTLTANTITNNSTGQRGGGVFVWPRYGNVALRGNTVTGNSAGGRGSNGGGGVFILAETSVVTLEGNLISYNSTGGGGGGVDIDAGNEGAVRIAGNTLNYNTAGWGGGIQLEATILEEIVNNVINGNTGLDRAAGLLSLGGRLGGVVITNNTLTDNRCEPCSYGGGGLYVNLFYDWETADIFNNIIWGNIAPIGADLLVENDGDLNFLKSTVNLFNNDFDRSAAGYSITLPIPLDPSNLDNVDPLFFDSPGEDFHLQPGSLVIDMGNNSSPGLPSLDKDGFDRVLDGGTGPFADMGAFESPGASPLFIREDRKTLYWPPMFGAQSYNMYRGSVGDLLDGDGDGLPDAGYGECVNHLDPDTTDMEFVDDTPLEPGFGFFYLMSMIDTSGQETLLGTTSAGLPRSVSPSCP